MNTNGTVQGWKKYANGNSGCGTGNFDDFDYFGTSVAYLGDLDGAGPAVSTLAAGAIGVDDGYPESGSVWLLFLDANENVLSHKEISNTSGMGFALGLYCHFGASVASLGDLDGDGVCDIAVGATGDADGGTDTGAVWIVFLNTSGGVKARQKISASSGGFDNDLGAGDQFGHSVAAPGDLNGDGIADLAVGCIGDDDGGTNRGATWILFLETDGTVQYEQKISSTEGGFGGTLHDENWFGTGIAGLGDHNGDGLGDIAVGAELDNDGGVERGAVWFLALDCHTPASATWRNPNWFGTLNPDVYSVTSLPALGGTFTASVDTDPGQSGCILVGYSAPTTMWTGWGNVLVDIFDPSGEVLGMPSGLGDPAVINLAVPSDLSFLGFEAATQAIRFGSGPVDLTNAYDLMLGW